MQLEKSTKTFHGVLPSLIQDISHIYQKTARENFDKLMKTVGTIKSTRQVIRNYILSNSSQRMIEVSI